MVVVMTHHSWGWHSHSLPSFTLILQGAGHVKCLSDAITQIILVIMENTLGQGQSALSPSRLLHVGSSLQRLLPPDLVLVELGEVVDDDGDGEGDDENSADTADQSHTLAGQGGGVHVAVAHRGHGDGRPPERGGNAGEGSLLHLSLSEVAEAGEDEDPHGDEHEEQAELLVAVPDGEAETLQSGGMSGELQDPEDPEDSEDLNDSLDVLVLALLHLVLHEEEGDVVREDGEDVNDVEAAFDEGPLVTGREEPEQELKCEPGNADGLYYGQGLVLFAGGIAGLVFRLEGRKCIETKCYGGYQDDRNT